MSRYETMFARNQGVFGAFVMLGDPDLETSAAEKQSPISA